MIFWCFDNERRRLKEVKALIRSFLCECLSLDLNVPKSQIYVAQKGIKFLGFRIFSFQKRLASGNARRARKRIRRLRNDYERGSGFFNRIIEFLQAWCTHASFGKHQVHSLCRDLGGFKEQITNQGKQANL